jgi:hypothetical protein
VQLNISKHNGEIAISDENREKIVKKSRKNREKIAKKIADVYRPPFHPRAELINNSPTEIKSLQRKFSSFQFRQK